MPRKYTPEERVAAFWSKVDKSGGPDACWLWTGIVNSCGYGRYRAERRIKQATHRLAWRYTNGVIPVTMCVLHTCDNRRCCNPAHLWLGTQVENVADRVSKGRSGGRFTKHLRTQHIDRRVAKVPRATVFNPVIPPRRGTLAAMVMDYVATHPGAKRRCIHAAFGHSGTCALHPLTKSGHMIRERGEDGLWRYSVPAGWPVLPREGGG